MFKCDDLFTLPCRIVLNISPLVVIVSMQSLFVLYDLAYWGSFGFIVLISSLIWYFKNNWNWWKSESENLKLGNLRPASFWCTASKWGCVWAVKRQTLRRLPQEYFRNFGLPWTQFARFHGGERECKGAFRKYERGRGGGDGWFEGGYLKIFYTEKMVGGGILNTSWTLRWEIEIFDE